MNFDCDDFRECSAASNRRFMLRDSFHHRGLFCFRLCGDFHGIIDQQEITRFSVYS